MEGRDQPRAVVYSQRMTAWLERLAPDASEALLLAVRGQHIRRWEIPRDQYPAGRVGYRTWRSDLGDFHAEAVSEILRDVGYDDATIARVGAMIRKENIKGDPETQLLEDVACLVFLEHEFADFAARHETEKVLRIIRRTWAKMSPAGRDAAAGLSLPPQASDLIARALNEAG